MPRPIKQPDDIRETHGRRMLRLEESAIIPACKRLCAQWHNALGACLTLDADRLRALNRRLVKEQIPEVDVSLAITAYAHECNTDKARLANPQMRLEFSRFLESGKFEQWLEAGYQRRMAALSRGRSEAAAQNADADKRETMQAIASAGLDFLATRRQAYLDLLAGGVTVIATNEFDDPRVRARMREICLAASRATPCPQEAAG